LSVEYLQIEARDTRYAYTTGRIRGLETHLLKDSDFARLKEAESLKETLQILSKIFPYSESIKVVEKGEEFEKGLEEEIKRTYQELRSFCPEPDLMDLFWLEYDFHNLKVLFKIRLQPNLSGRRISELEKNLFSAGTQNIEALKKAVLNEDLSALSPDFKILLHEDFSLIRNNFYPQAIDAFLDKQLFKCMSSKLAKYSDPFLKGLIQRQIDFFNITAFLRVEFWGRKDQREVLGGILTNGGTIDKKQLLELTGQPASSLREMLRATDYREAIEGALKEWENDYSLFSLDLFFDRYILGYTKIGFYTTFGRESLINYIFLKKQEIKTLRGILRGKFANLAREKMEKYLMI